MLNKPQSYKVVKKIPEGETLSYKDVAQKAGSPRPWRAVGNALTRRREAFKKESKAD